MTKPATPLRRTDVHCDYCGSVGQVVVGESGDGCMWWRCEDRGRCEAASRLTENAPDALREALDVIAHLVDDQPCRSDHHGFCQAHRLERVCSVARGRGLLDRFRPSIQIRRADPSNPRARQCPSCGEWYDEGNHADAFSHERVEHGNLRYRPMPARPFWRPQPGRLRRLVRRLMGRTRSAEGASHDE